MRAFIIWTCLLAVCALGLNALGAEIVVDDTPGPWRDHADIQSAIDAASPGDRIRVYYGSYLGGIQVNKSVRIIGNSSVATYIYDQDLSDGFNVTADNVYIAGFNISDCRHGVVFWGMTNGTVSECRIVDNSYRGVNVYDASTIMINNNRIFGNVDGIYLNRTDNVAILYNWIENNTKSQPHPGWEYNDGIRGDDDVTNVSIQYNDILRNAYGIDMDSNTDTGFWHITTAYNDIFRHTSNAVWAEALNESSFVYNEIHHNYIGLYLSLHNGPWIFRNDIYSNSAQGIELYRGWAVIENNTICWNGLGIQGFQTNGLIVLFNEIFNNSGYGVELDGSLNAEVHHNNFYGNNNAGGGTQGYDDTGTNTWDNGTAGNFWDDYTGPDNDDNGIGDWPYNLSGGAGAQDRYPLVWRQNNSAPREVPEMPLVAAVSAVAFLFVATDIRRRRRN